VLVRISIRGLDLKPDKKKKRQGGIDTEEGGGSNQWGTLSPAGPQYRKRAPPELISER